MRGSYNPIQIFCQAILRMGMANPDISPYPGKLAWSGYVFRTPIQTRNLRPRQLRVWTPVGCETTPEFSRQFVRSRATAILAAGINGRDAAKRTLAAVPRY